MTWVTNYVAEIKPWESTYCISLRILAFVGVGMTEWVHLKKPNYTCCEQPAEIEFNRASGCRATTQETEIYQAKSWQKIDQKTILF